MDGGSIGSLGWQDGEEGVRNLTVDRAVLKGTTNGLRIKTWAMPNSGFVKNVSFSRVTMNRVANPILVDQNYCPGNISCPTEVSYPSIITLLSTLYFQGALLSADTVCYITFRVRESRSPTCHTRTSRGRRPRRWRCGSTAARAGRAPESPRVTFGWGTGKGGERPSPSAGTRMGSRMGRLFRRVAWPTRK